ncbi:type II toxin-antitoxin system RelE/ParE family toxin [Rodentibacter ratti]|uniref:Plasmid stabilization system protein n=1 Tax=Rodentibacter ratti TaxID=1906745 RepID=A0A1V3L8X5_9PAST|nr:type II toxin-antitoxin system RelE/ParE family toxin [Rodentibacter ratti]OOF86345.1 plasmid stabilization system protein [Rodentibacter ratti]
MHNVVITQNAQHDIIHIIENVTEFTYSFISGVKLYEDIYAKIDMIAFMPQAIGRLRDDGKREAFCRGYRIVYDIIDDVIYIQTVIHSRRLYPRP